MRNLIKIDFAATWAERKKHIRKLHDDWGFYPSKILDKL
jgi:hypothetical protein